MAGTFGSKIRELRISRGLSQQRVARDIGLSQSAITSFERNVNEPSFNMILKFADYFHVSPFTLMPFDAENGEDVIEIADSLGRNPKLRLLFDRSRALSDSDLDAVLAIVSAIRGEHHE